MKHDSQPCLWADAAEVMEADVYQAHNPNPSAPHAGPQASLGDESELCNVPGERLAEEPDVTPE